MRKTLPWMLLAGAFLVSAAPGCKSGQEQTNAKPEQKAAQAAVAGPTMVELELQKYGLPLVMRSPDEVSASKADDFVRVKTGDGLLMEVHEGIVDLAARKAGLEAIEVDKLKEYVVDDANIIVYEQSIMGQPESHFVAAIMADGVHYFCEDAPDQHLDKAQVERLVALCQSASTKQESPKEGADK